MVSNQQSLAHAIESNLFLQWTTEFRLLTEGESSSVLNQFHSRLHSADALQSGSWIRVSPTDGRHCLAYILNRKLDGSINVLALFKDAVTEHIHIEHPVSADFNADHTSFPPLEAGDSHSLRLQFNSQVLKTYGIHLLHLNPGNDIALTEPGIEEIQPFIDAGLDVTPTVNRILVQIDDRIQITKGPFVGAYATVKQAQSSGIVANLQISGSDCTSCSATIRYRHFKRVFDSGQEVVIIVGLRSGTHGIIASSSDTKVTLLLDDCKTQVKTDALLLTTILTL